MAGSYDERNSTVRWIPGFVRRWLGLTGDDKRPRYDERRSDPQRYGDASTNWVPGPARRALGVEYREPKRYPPSPTPYQPDQPINQTASRPMMPGRAPNGGAPQYTVPDVAAPGGNSRMGFDRADERMRQMAAAVPTPPMGGSEARMRDIAAEATYTPGNVRGRNLTPGADIGAMPQTEGYVQPISFLLRGYARGAMPPQGLEQFTKELRATGQQLWEFYEYWFRFQTDDVGRLINSVRGGSRLRPVTKTTDDLDTTLQYVPVETAPPVAVTPAPMAQPSVPVAVVPVAVAPVAPSTATPVSPIVVAPVAPSTATPVSPIVVEPPPPPPPDAPAADKV